MERESGKHAKCWAVGGGGPTEGSRRGGGPRGGGSREGRGGPPSLNGHFFGLGGPSNHRDTFTHHGGGTRGLLRPRRLVLFPTGARNEAIFKWSDSESLGSGLCCGVSEGGSQVVEEDGGGGRRLTSAVG